MKTNKKTTPLRTILNVWLEQCAMSLNLHDKNILEVGIAGDAKPSGSHEFFGIGNKWTTMDIEPKWEPDIIGDITNNKIPDNSYDLVIMTQTIEHVWDFKKAISELHRISKKYVILDCPWMYPYHQDTNREDTPALEWDDYWRISPSALNKILKEVGFKDVKLNFEQLVTICLAKK